MGLDIHLEKDKYVVRLTHSEDSTGKKISSHKTHKDAAKKILDMERSSSKASAPGK